MLLDDVRLKKLKAILEDQDIYLEGAELEATGIQIAKFVSLKEFLRQKQGLPTIYELSESTRTEVV